MVTRIVVMEGVKLASVCMIRQVSYSPDLTAPSVVIRMSVYGLGVWESLLWCGAGCG